MCIICSPYPGHIGQNVKVFNYSKTLEKKYLYGSKTIEALEYTAKVAVRSMKEIFKTQYKNFNQGSQTVLTCLGASRWMDQKVPFCPQFL